MKPFNPQPLLLATLIAAAFPAFAADETSETNETNEQVYQSTLPTITVVGQPETSVLKGYINYDEASVTRNEQPIKETPQTIDTLNIQKNKNYGTNDLSSILEGNAGIDAAYDMRGESIYLRGFQADASDIYRDGVRESGQVRRSTANIERVEILKGPSSVLYGRTNGGGVINMVSKYANFKQSRNIGASYGSWANRSLNLDINQVINPNVALRLTGETGRANSFRSGIDSKNAMVSPSITVRLNNGLKWTGQYTYDNVERTPDRAPDKSVYDRFGLSYRTGFAHPNDFVKDKLQVWRSDLEYRFGDNWKMQWQLAHRRASQDFDHFYAGSAAGSKIRRNYAWQQTENKTLSSNFTLNGDYRIGQFDNHLTVGVDFSREQCDPTLGYRGSFTALIDPYNHATWTPSGRLLPPLTRNHHKARSQGIFVQNIFSATPNVRLVLGGRYERYTFRSENKLNGNIRQYSGHTFSPNIGAVWNINPTHTVYASYTKGFSPYGGRSYLSIDTGASAVLDSSPEYNRQYEVGVKSDWLNNRLSTTLSAYQIERFNIRYRPDPVNNPFHWEVSGKHRSRGLELSAIGQIVPKKLYLRGSFGVMQAKIVKDKANPQNEGRHLSNTSNVTGNLFFRYTPTENLYGEIGITGSGKRYGYTRSGAAANLPGFARADAMLGWNYKQLNLTLAVSNLFNKQYWRSDAMPAAPRSYTARVNYSF